MSNYTVILADPPWLYANRHSVRKDNPARKPKFGLGVASRYPGGVIPTQALCDLTVGQLGASPSMLFLWATWPNLPDALAVMSAWGYRYVTAAFVWVKTYPSGKPFIGPGSYTASNSEPVLLGVRGQCKSMVKRKLVPQIITSPAQRFLSGPEKHSQKPIEIHRRIEDMLGPVKRLELFARMKQPGWDATGLELDGKDIRCYLAGSCLGGCVCRSGPGPVISVTGALPAPAQEPDPEPAPSSSLSSSAPTPVGGGSGT